jgi:hypothetical protein
MLCKKQIPISRPKKQLILKLMVLKDKTKLDIIYYKTS